MAGENSTHGQAVLPESATSSGSRALPPGATIAVIAPGGIPDPDRLERGIATVQRWGYVVAKGPHLRARDRYTAGTAEERARDLVWALTTPGIDAVWLARGGFGAVHVLPALPSRLLPRVIIGYSDATALFSALLDAGGLALLHGPVLQELPDHVDAENALRLRSLLATGSAPPLHGRVARSGPPVRGRLVGGNLAVLASLAGTRWQLDARGSLLLLEDVAEPPYRLDRLVTQLRQAGALDGVAGLVLGEFRRCEPPPGSGWTIEELLLDLLTPLGVPILAGVPVGHAQCNAAFWLGVTAILDGETLSFP